MSINGVIRLAWLLVFSSVLLSGCAKKEDIKPPVDSTSHANIHTDMYAFLKDWYLWNDRLPEVDANSYDTPEKLLEAVRYKDLDRWSYVEDTQKFKAYFVNGQFAGHGFGMRLDKKGNLRVSFVYTDSPMGRQGVTRGYQILKINGQDVSSLIASNTLYQTFGEDKTGVQNSFLVEDLAGNQREFTIPKEEVTINAVLHHDVKEVAGKKVGYLVYNTFINKSKSELDEAFAYFQEQGISELVLDLRYNGGGSLNSAQYLAGLIGASRAGSGKFAELMYNVQKKASNKAYYFSPNGLDAKLDRVFVITTRSSASASEAVINSLRPYINVITIGDDTHGKPVGMNGKEFGSYTLMAIMFKVANVNGEAEYFDGIKANAKIADDLTANFGDPTEDCLQETLYYIEHGHFSGTTARRGFEEVENQIELTGFRGEVGAF